MLNFPIWSRDDARRLRHLKRDPLWTEAYQQQVDRMKEVERCNRQARRREVIDALLRRPSLGIALLSVRLLGHLHEKANATIQQYQDAEFETAAQQVFEARKKEQERDAHRRAQHDAHVRTRRVDILVKQGCWWLSKGQ